MVSLVKKLFGSRNERVLRQHFKQVDKINALELVMQKLTDAELQAKTVEFKARKELPCYFKSIATPTGDIYLTGGS